MINYNLDFILSIIVANADEPEFNKCVLGVMNATFKNAYNDEGVNNEGKKVILHIQVRVSEPINEDGK